MRPKFDRGGAVSQVAPAGNAVTGHEQQIVLVRHAATSWSRSGRHTGRTDIPLDEDGIRDAKDLESRLVGLNPARVFVSPLIRAIATCELAGFSAQAELDPMLMEWDYGEYEGMTTSDIRLEHPGWNVFVDGCPGGEDAVAVGNRADAVLERVLEGFLSPIIIFGHAHTLRVLAARWLGLDATAGRHFSLNPCSVSSLGYEREDRVVSSWNT
jgi:broad specificity phosphatase PhoE